MQSAHLVHASANLFDALASGDSELSRPYTVGSNVQFGRSQRATRKTFFAVFQGTADSLSAEVAKRLSVASR